MPSVNGVIDYFLHPSFNFITSSVTSPSAITNPYTGTNTLAATVGLSSSFGLTWAVHTPPPSAGFRLGTMKVWDDRLLQVVVFHTLASGEVVASQIFESFNDSGILFWENLIPTAVIVDVFPNFSVDFSWLIGI